MAGYILSERPDLRERENEQHWKKKIVPNPRAKEAAGAVLSEALIIEVSKWRDSDVLPYKWHHISGQVSPVCRVAPAWCMDDGILAGPPTHYVTPIGSWTLTLSSFLSYKPLSNLHPVAQPRVFDIYCATASIKNVLLVIMYASFIDWNMMRYGSFKRWGIWVTGGSDEWWLILVVVSGV